MGCSAGMRTVQHCRTNSQSSLRFCAQGDEDFHAKFMLGDKLGQGAFGQVRVAINRANEEKVVVKIVATGKPSKLQMSDTSMMNQTYEAEAREECRLWARCSNSFYCVQLIEYFFGESAAYFVMEQCRCSLFDRMEDLAEYSEVQMRNIFREMILGIEHVHDNAIVHRDIKPDNFLYGMDNSVKLADFGLSSHLSHRRFYTPTLTGTTGTIPFMSPEMLRKGRYAFKTDVWSYGVSLYFMIFGNFPYGPKAVDGTQMKYSILHGPPPPYTFAHEAAQSCADKLQHTISFIKRVMNRHASQRYTSNETVNDEYMDLGFFRGTTGGTSSDTLDSSGFKSVLKAARQRTLDFEALEETRTRRKDPTVYIDLEALLLRLQQAGDGNVPVRRSFSMDAPPDERDSEVCCLRRASTFEAKSTISNPRTCGSVRSTNSDNVFRLSTQSENADWRASWSGSVRSTQSDKVFRLSTQSENTDWMASLWKNSISSEEDCNRQDWLAYRWINRFSSEDDCHLPLVPPRTMPCLPSKTLR